MHQKDEPRRRARRLRATRRVVLSACTAGGGAVLAVTLSVPTFGLQVPTIPVRVPTVRLPTVPKVTPPKIPSVPLPKPAPAPAPSGGGGSSSGSGSGSSGGSSGSGGTTTPKPTKPSGGGVENQVPSGSGGGSLSGGRTQRGGGRGGGGRHGGRRRPRRPAVVAPGGLGVVRAPGGAPTPSAPGFTLAPPDMPTAGVPNLFIDRFRIPPFLLPIYQAAGTEYQIPWQVLAGINEIETDYGRNLNISTAGAVGWMQFMPATWKMYGVDANGDKRKDPFNPVDAIFAAARYLKAAGGDKDIKKAIFAYNHADWYVQSVLLRAKLIGGIPDDLIGSLTGLTQGRFPVAARATYASEVDLKAAKDRGKHGNPTTLVEASKVRKQIRIFAKKGSPVVATQDARVVKIGRSPTLGHYVVIEDVYGNRYGYAHLSDVAKTHAVPRPHKTTDAEVRKELHLPKNDPKPTRAASAGRHPGASAKKLKARSRVRAKRARAKRAKKSPLVRKERLFANRIYPKKPKTVAPAPKASVGVDLLKSLGLRREDVVARPLKKGSQVIAGTVLGHVGTLNDGESPHLLFRIRPAGRGAPLVDPKPILDGWKLLEQTAVYRVAGRNPFFGPDAKYPSIGQILLLGKSQLQRRLLADPRVQIYSCGRRDIRTGAIDRRVMATLEFLAVSGLKPTVTALKCGHGFLTSSGNVSEHSSGNAVDIGAINGIPITGHQGKGSITDTTVRRLLTLQGTVKPHQIITLMHYPGTDNTLSLPDHYNHIHVGFRPTAGSGGALGKQADAILKPGQWTDLIARLGTIKNPTVKAGPKRFVLGGPD